LMNLEKAIELGGTIMSVLPGTMFRVALANEHLVLAHISGKMRKRFICLTVDDRVRLEMSSYDPPQPRLDYRLSCFLARMTSQSLTSNGPAAKARRASMSFWTYDRGGTQASHHFQLNPSGRSFFCEFPRRSLGKYHNGYGRFACSLKFAQSPSGDWQAILVTQ